MECSTSARMTTSKLSTLRIKELTESSELLEMKGRDTINIKKRNKLNSTLEIRKPRNNVVDLMVGTAVIN